MFVMGRDAHKSMIGERLSLIVNEWSVPVLIVNVVTVNELWLANNNMMYKYSGTML